MSRSVEAGARLPSAAEDHVSTRPSPAPLVAADLHVESFRQARAARRSALVEDYVELIADLLDNGGEARQVAIAARLGVAQPTVAKMLKRLIEDGLVAHTPRRGASLTASGRALALRSRERHRLVERFLLALGVAAATARGDAEGLEHHVSQETLDAFARFVARDGSDPEDAVTARACKYAVPRPGMKAGVAAPSEVGEP